MRPLAAVLALAAWLAGGEPPQEACAPTSGQETLRLVNAHRADGGLAALTADTVLARVALLHAEDMAARERLGHDGSDGSDPAERVGRAGYAWIWVGENVAAGQETPEEVVSGWMRSPGHRSNILSEHAVSAGVAMARSAGGYGTWWVMVYAAADPPSAAVTACHP